MSKETEKYGDPQERRSLACMGTVDLITHAIKQSEAVSAQQSRIDALERALNPSAWTKEMSDAWHLNIPDTQMAFYALYRATLHPSDNETGGVGIK